MHVLLVSRTVEKFGLDLELGAIIAAFILRASLIMAALLHRDRGK